MSHHVEAIESDVDEKSAIRLFSECARAACSLFAELGAAEVEQLAQMMTVLQLQPGEVVTVQGEVCSFFGVVLSGSLSSSVSMVEPHHASSASAVINVTASHAIKPTQVFGLLLCRQSRHTSHHTSPAFVDWSTLLVRLLDRHVYVVDRIGWFVRRWCTREKSERRSPNQARRDVLRLPDACAAGAFRGRWQAAPRTGTPRADRG